MIKNFAQNKIFCGYSWDPKTARKTFFFVGKIFFLTKIFSKKKPSPTSYFKQIFPFWESYKIKTMNVTYICFDTVIKSITMNNEKGPQVCIPYVYRVRIRQKSWNALFLLYNGRPAP